MPRLVLAGARLFDVDQGDVRAASTVVVEAGRIADVVDVAPRSAEDVVVDASGLTLLPGLIDCHVHLCLGAEPDPALSFARESVAATTLRAALHARSTVESGVTTVRDLGGRDTVVQALRDAIARGVCVGPRVLAAGQGICMTGGHGWRTIAREADGVDGVRRAVREQLKASADWIKVFASGGVMTPNTSPVALQLSLEELAVAVTEARNAGKRVAAHAQGGPSIVAALDAGVSTIEHGFFLDEEICRRMVELGVALVPTLLAPRQIAREGAAAGVAAEAIEKASAVGDRHREAFRTALRAGVAIAAGTDAGTACNPHGRLAAELALMVEAGMDPAAAIRSATSAAAHVLGLEREIGHVARGLAADLVAVHGDPLADAAVLGKPELVIARGRVVLDRGGWCR